MCKKGCKEEYYMTGEVILATKVIYEGFIPEDSDLNDTCVVTVHDAIEDLYKRGSEVGGYYYAGEGLEETNNTFSVKFGTIAGTAKEGDWLPTWDDVQNKPEPLNITGGNNIEITGSYPNLVINATIPAQSGIQNVKVQGNNLPKVDNSVEIPIASSQNLGLVRVGAGIEVSDLGVISVDIQAGQGVYKNGNTISVPVNVSGSGNVVSSVESTLGGLTITKSNIVVPNYQAGDGIDISSNGDIVNSKPNANHTGDVTGDQELTITNQAVTNSKLANMPAITLKGNSSNTTSQPTDLSVGQVKSMLQIGSQTLIIDTFPATINVGSNQTTSAFIKLPEDSGELTGYNINLQDGEYDGQHIFIEYNRYRNTTQNYVVLTGNLINFIPSGEDTLVTEIIDANIRRTVAFWSVSKQAWLTKIIKMAE